MTLVGKGVVFDTGGLDIKPANGMELMKKDMGGAATALTLARLIMESALDVRLRVLIPIVENSISARAMRPGDILKSRKGLTVEIGNTDAEGRLILADALALAAEEAPDLMFDFATLTGAARVALGPDLPPFYTDDEALARDIAHHAVRVRDPVWRLPLWRPYEFDAGEPLRRPQQCSRQPVRGIGDGGPVPAALRRGRQIMGAFRRLRLESEAARARAAGRRDPVGARAVRPVADKVSGVRKAPSPALRGRGLG